METMSQGKIAINRTLVGVLALVCLAAAAGIWRFAPSEDNWKLWQGAFTRVGLLMSAFWIALPSGDREAAWANVTPLTFAGIILAVAGVAARPKIAVPVLIVLTVIGFLVRPRPKKRPQNRP